MRHAQRAGVRDVGAHSVPAHGEAARDGWAATREGPFAGGSATAPHGPRPTSPSVVGRKWSSNATPQTRKPRSSAAFERPLSDSNRRPLPYHGSALPIE